MPPKTVTCSICGKDVMKSQTYSIGDGKRACKEHEGVVETKDKLLLQDKQEKIRQEENKKKEWERKTDPIGYYVQRDPKKFCWCCVKEGITIQQYNFGRLIALSELFQLGEKLNFLDPAAFHKQINDRIPGADKVLFMIKVNSQDDDLMRRLNRDYRDVMAFTGLLNICSGCAKNLNLLNTIDEQYFKPMRDKKITFEEMSHNYAIMEVSGLNKAIDEVAARNIELRKNMQ